MATSYDIDNRFTYHPPTPADAAKYERIRREGRELAHLLNGLVPEGRELALALTHLEEVVMFANAGIARADEA